MKWLSLMIQHNPLSRFYRRLGLEQKIIIPFLGVFLSVLMIGAFVLGTWFTHTLEGNLYKEVDSFSTRALQDFQTIHQTLDTQVRLLANQEGIRQALVRTDRAAMLQLLLPFKAEFDLDLIKVVDVNQSVWADVRKGFLLQAHLEDRIATASASSGLHLTDVMTVSDDRQVLLVAVAPIKSAEGIVGGIIIGQSVSHDLVKKIAAGSSKSLVVFSKHNAIATSDPQLLQQPLQPLSPKEPARSIQINKHSYIAKSSAFSGRSQSLLVEVLYPVKPLEQAKNALWINIVILSGLGSITVVVIGSLIGRAIAAKLNAQFQSLQSALKDLRAAQAQLIQTEKMSSLGQMVAGVAHEINNPANFIYANVTYLEQYIQSLFALIGLYGDRASEPTIQAFRDDIDLDYIQTDSAKILKSMQTGTERIIQIVLSLRNFSRLDESEMKTVDIHEGIESTLLLLNHRLGHRITIQRKYADLPQIECYPAQLNQLFFNLLDNAVDAIEERLGNQKDIPGEIMIQTWINDRHQTIVHIQDNGCGMSPNTQERIFDPFFTTRPVGQGTGLGMAVVYQIIQQHGGEIAIESAVGVGTEVQIRLPQKSPSRMQQGAGGNPNLIGN
jgi:two-component system, NtrC family, sensor kinase